MLKKAFTLIELLVVIAIIAILAAILFPVFAQAKAAAKKTAAISNFKQLDLGALMYCGDYDDKMMIVTYNLSYDANPLNPDTIPHLLMKPYLKNRPILADPMDPANDRQRILIEQVVDPNTVPYKDAQEEFNYDYKSDWGLNWQSICPLWINQADGSLVVDAIVLTQVNKPGQMIMAIDSVWNRTPSGAPYGGGNVGVDPPCIVDPNFFGNGAAVDGDTRLLAEAGYNGWYWYGAWEPSFPNNWNVFGGVWPWHSSGNIAITSFMDGHTRGMAVSATTVGCNVQDFWGGNITNDNKYMWSFR